MNHSDPDYNDKKNQRRDSIKHKKGKTKKFDDLEFRDQSRLRKAFKHKRTEIDQEELWEEWQDEIS